jgi:hypothetical protein
VDDDKALVEIGGGHGLVENGGALVEDGVAVEGGAAALGEDGDSARGGWRKIWQPDDVVSFSRQDLENFQVLVLYIRELNTGGPHCLPTSSDSQRWRSSGGYPKRPPAQWISKF